MTTVLAHEELTLGTSTPRLAVDRTMGIVRYLTIDGVRAYHLSYACGTCGIVLRREPGAPVGALDAEQVRDRLNSGLDHLHPEVVDAFSRQLPYGPYLVMLMDVQPRLVQPGTADDYFVAEVPGLWAEDEGGGATVAYYRFGERRIDENNQLFQFAVPLTDRLDPDTVAHYATTAGHPTAGDSAAGGPTAAGDPAVGRSAAVSHAAVGHPAAGRPVVAGRPTAVSLAFLDVEGPWDSRVRHWGLTHYLLDGHHKMAAGPVRILTFVAMAESVATDDELRRLPTLL